MSLPFCRELVVKSLRELGEAIRQFAGENVEGAVVPSVVREMMLEYDPVVRHYEIVEKAPENPET